MAKQKDIPFYVNCTIKEFKDALDKAQFKQKVKTLIDIDENGNNKYALIEQDWFTKSEFFYNAVELDKLHWKRDLKANQVKDSNLKLDALLNIMLWNQKIIMDSMIKNNKEDIIWKTIYANEYANNNNIEDTTQKIIINIDTNKTGKIQIK